MPGLRTELNHSDGGAELKPKTRDVRQADRIERLLLHRDHAAGGRLKAVGFDKIAGTEAPTKSNSNAEGKRNAFNCTRTVDAQLAKTRPSSSLTRKTRQLDLEYQHKPNYIT